MQILSAKVLRNLEVHKDLGYIVKWMDTANGSYYVISLSEADAV